MKLDIDLGDDNGHGSFPMEMPKRKYYPSFTYSGKVGDGEEKYEFPSEGEMTIRFRKVNETTSTDEEGNTRHSCTFEVRRIVGADIVEESTSSARNLGKDTEHALDSLAKSRKVKDEDY